MLDLNPEAVCFLISKAKEFHAKEEVVIPEEPSSPSDDWARQVLADHADDFSYQEFKSAVNDLEPDQQASLVALMWLGRGEKNNGAPPAPTPPPDGHHARRNTSWPRPWLRTIWKGG